MGKGRCNDLTGKRFDFLKVIKRAPNHITSGGNSLVAWECECDCGRRRIVPATRMIQYLDKHGYVYETQKYYDDLYGLGGGHLTYDFCVNLGKIIVLIECNGKQHYQPVSYFGGKGTFDRQLVHDARKREYAIERGIPLIELDCSCNMTMNEYFNLISIEFSKYV